MKAKNFNDGLGYCDVCWRISGLSGWAFHLFFSCLGSSWSNKNFIICGRTFSHSHLEWRFTRALVCWCGVFPLVLVSIFSSCAASPCKHSRNRLHHLNSRARAMLMNFLLMLMFALFSQSPWPRRSAANKPKMRWNLYEHHNAFAITQHLAWRLSLNNFLIKPISGAWVGDEISPEGFIGSNQLRRPEKCTSSGPQWENEERMEPEHMQIGEIQSASIAQWAGGKQIIINLHLAAIIKRLFICVQLSAAISFLSHHFGGSEKALWIMRCRRAMLLAHASRLLSFLWFWKGEGNYSIEESILGPAFSHPSDRQ